MHIADNLLNYIQITETYLQWTANGMIGVLQPVQRPAVGEQEETRVQ